MAIVNPNPDKSDFTRHGVEVDTVEHPETGELLLNPRTFAPILQERPHADHDREVESAKARLEKAQLALRNAEEMVKGAKAELARVEKEDPDARWEEIVAALVAKDAEISDEDRERIKVIGAAQAAAENGDG